MRGDVDARIGEVFRRLSIMRLELGEGALDRTLHDVLRTLGACALSEAERRARSLTERARPASRDVRVTAFAERRGADPLDGCDDGV